DRFPCQVARIQPVNNPVITPTRVPFNSNWAGQKLRASHSCMYRLFWYSRLSQTRSVRMTKDSPSAASLALRSRCSAFRRCRSSSPLGPTSHTEVGPGSQKISTETTESEGKCWIDFDLSTFGYTRILPTSLTQIAQIVRHLQNIYKQSLDLG